MADPFVVPGFVNAHSHAFQRALRGRALGDDFWSWRDAMLAEAERQTPETVRIEYAETYREMRAAGYTAVGEFHYLGLPEAHAALEAGREAGVELVLLLAAYARGGLERFRQGSVAEYLAQLDE
ncbi:MAG: amidohydrolase family protein, partial [Actinomycetota bacterium]|nr:amidohydrolase family protein [Actinomycetota bacterium]